MREFKTLSGSKVFITGATGLIGKSLVSYLLDCGCQITILSRSKEKAESMFGTRIKIVEADVKNFQPQKMEIDYVIHAAANTSSLSFVEEPISVITDSILGTINVLEFAKLNSVKGFVYLSTMEVYGHPDVEEKITEDHSTNLDTMSIRSSYPESKRICECLCASYHKQYSLPAKVIRLTQTFGPGVLYNDKRVFAEFARCVIENRDIILHTDGSTKRSYLYTEDAVRAILTVLISGQPGQAYNAANEETFCSILEMAQLVADKCACGNISVRVENANNIQQYGYAPKLIMNLSVDKLRSLGWKPLIGLKEMYDRMIVDMRSQLV